MLETASNIYSLYLNLFTSQSTAAGIKILLKYKIDSR